MARYVGIDIGGTSARLGLFDSSRTTADEAPLLETTVQTGKDSLPEPVIRKLCESLKTWLPGDGSSLSIGVAMAGFVDGGSSRGSSNLPAWSGVDLREMIIEHFPGSSVVVGNDVAAHTAYLGEKHAKGKHEGLDRTMLCVAIGTGLGAGIYEDGVVVTRTLGRGELGHVRASDDGWETRHIDSTRCEGWALDRQKGAGGCRGCVEQTVSGPGIAALFSHLTKDSARGSGIDELTAHDVAARAHAGVPEAIAVFEYVGVVLANAIAPVRALLNPQMLVFSGGVSKSLSLFRAALERRLAEHCFPENEAFADHYQMEIRVDTMENGLLGAALLGLQQNPLKRKTPRAQRLGAKR